MPSILLFPSSGLSPAQQVSLLRNQKTKNNLPQSCCWWGGGNTRRPFVSFCGKWKGWSQTQELLCSLCLLCVWGLGEGGLERSDLPRSLLFEINSSSVPLFPSVNLCCYPSLFFFLPCSTVFRTFPSAGGLRNRPVDQMFQGLAKATASWTSAASVCYHTRSYFHPPLNWLTGSLSH